MGDNLDENWAVEAPDAAAEADLVEDDADSRSEEEESNAEQDATDSIPEQQAKEKASRTKKRPLEAAASDEASVTDAQSSTAAKLSKRKRPNQLPEADLSSAQSVLDALWACCCAQAAAATPELSSACWLSTEDIAVVESFGQHTAPKLPGFIKGSLRLFSCREGTRATQS